MKKFIIIPAAAVALLISCKAKTLVNSEPTKAETVAKSPVTTGSKRLSSEMLAQGKSIYENSCAKCHDLPVPAQHTDKQWVAIMNAMAPNAHLTAAQSELVYDYVTYKN